MDCHADRRVAAPGIRKELLMELKIKKIGSRFVFFSVPLFPFLSCDVTTRILQIGGLGEQVLGKRLQIEEFPSMKHGWTVRGGENTKIC